MKTHHVTAVIRHGEGRRGSPKKLLLVLGLLCGATLEAAPAPPTLTSIARRCNGSSPGIEIHWSAVADATEYEIHRNGTLVYTAPGSWTGFWNQSGLRAGQNYSYQVAARNASGTSVLSNALSITAPTDCGTAPPNAIAVSGRSFSGIPLTYSPDGTATGTLVYGGQATAIDASWAGKVVLVDRGTGTFYAKVHNVQLSGGVACVIANNVAGSFTGTLGEGNNTTIPVLTVSQESGVTLKTLVGFSATVTSYASSAAPAGPKITAQPQGLSVALGAAANFSVTAEGSDCTYQWQLNGGALPGATRATLALTNVQPGAAGDYTVVVRSGDGSVTSSAARLSLIPGRLINLSILTPVAPDDPLTVGAVIGGNGTNGLLPLLIRAAGPSLSAFGISGPNADPKLEVFSGSSLVQSNDNWGGIRELNTFAELVGAFPFADAGSKDAALPFAPFIATPPASYTVRVTSVGNASGPIIAEVYDGAQPAFPSASTPRLINMSVLKQIPASGALTAGFVIGPGSSKQVLIRAIGPALGVEPFHLPGVMPNPKITLFGAGGVMLGSNDDWGGDPTLAAAFAAAGAFRLPAGSRDAGVLATLAPGNYTAQVGASTALGAATGGSALVEIYDMEISAPPIIATQPVSLAAAADSTALFMVSAVGATGYQWQRLPAGSANWITLSDADGFSGTATACLLASGGVANNGDQFRVTASNASGVARSNSVSFTVTAASGAITVAGFNAAPVLPLSLLTVPAVGLTSNAITYVEFVNSAAEPVAQVPAVAVTATTVTVSVPPLVDAAGTGFATGTLSARIVQLVGGRPLASNSFVAAHVLAPATSKVQPGALALGMLQAEWEETRAVLAALPGTAYDNAGTRTILSDAIQSLQGSIADVQRAMAEGNATITVGTGAGTVFTLTTRDLQALDNFLAAGLQAIAANPAVPASGEGRTRAADSVPSPVQISARNLQQAAESGSSSDALWARAREFASSLRTAQVTPGDKMLLLSAGALAVTAGLGLSLGLSVGTLAVVMGTGTLGGAGIAAHQIWAAGNGLAQVSTSPDQLPARLSPGAAELWSRLLNAIAQHRNPSGAPANVLAEINRPGVASLADAFADPNKPLGGFLSLAIEERNGAKGLAAPSVWGSAGAPLAAESPPLVNPSPAPNAVFKIREAGYYSFAAPFTVTALPDGESVFTGWRLRAPLIAATAGDSLNQNGYMSGGDTSELQLRMVRGGLFVIASFDLAHTLTIRTNGNGGTVATPTPAPVRYVSAKGRTAPVYLHGQKVALLAKANPGFVFSNWSDGYTGTDNPTTNLAITRDTIVTANFSATTSPPPQPPPAPTGLTTTAGNQQVSLSWTASPGATSYRVKLAISSGGPYATVASPAATTFTHTGLTNGIPHYYVVTAVNSSGESGNSNEASATPAAGSAGTIDLRSPAFTGYFNIVFTGTYTRYGSTTSVTDSYWIFHDGSGKLHARLDENIGTLTTSGSVTWQLTRGSPSWLPSWAGITWQGRLLVAGQDAHASGGGSCEGTASNGAFVKGTWTARWSGN